jgi:1-hydroxycarotenoid 3,4-desaturase
MVRRASHGTVIGAGVGGFACAIDLAGSGYAVALLERALQVGGKIRTVGVGGLAVDARPTVRWVFDELFATAGRSDL